MKRTLLVIAAVAVTLGILPDTVIGAGLLRLGPEDLAARGQGLSLLRAGLVLGGLYLAGLAWFAPPETAPAPPRLGGPPPRREWALVAGLAALATALRLIALNQGIWYDEMLTMVNYMPLGIGQILTTFKDPNNHILYSVLARLSLDIFGTSIWAFRLPAVLFGVAGVVASYRLTRRVAGWQESLLVALFLAVSYHHVWFSQNARGYSALLFFSVLSSIWFLDALRSGRRATWLAYALAGALGAMTHLTIGFLILAHGLILVAVLWRDRAQPGAFGRTGVGLAYGFVPLTLGTFLSYATLLPDMLGGALLGSGIQRGYEWSNPVWAMTEFIRSMSVGLSGAAVLAVGGAVALVGLADYGRKSPAIAAMLVVPVATGLILMTSIGYTLFPRFFFFAAAFGVMIVIRGSIVIGDVLAARLTPSRPGLALVPALAVTLASLAALPKAYLPKQDYTGAIAWIEANRQPGDVVAVIGIAEFPFLTYYGKQWLNVQTADELARAADGPAAVWALHTMPVQLNSASPDIVAVLDSRYTFIRDFPGSLGGGAIVVHRAPGKEQ